MLVKEVMSTDLVTCSIDDSLQVGAERMLTNRVGSVVVLSEGQPTGIVTETDCLHAGCVTERPFTEIPVRKVMSQSLITITPNKTLRRAAQQLEQESVKKLLVVEDMELVGVLTVNDVVDNYQQIKADITALVRQGPPRNLENPSFDAEDS